MERWLGLVLACVGCGARTLPGSQHARDAGTDSATSSCTLSADRPLAQLANPAVQIAVDATHVYWSDGTALHRVPVTGGNVEEITRRVLLPFALDETELFFFRDDGQWNGVYQYHLERIAKAGGASVMVTKPNAGPGLHFLPGHIVVDTLRLYGVTGETVYSMSKQNGSDPATLVPSATFQQIVQLVRDGDDVYYTTWLPGGVWRVPAAGGQKTARVAGDDHSQALVLDDRNVYWTSQLEARGVRRAPKGGGTVTVLARPEADPRGLAQTDRHLYWAEYDLGKIWRTPKAGGTSEVIASGIVAPNDVAVDDHCVYWGGAHVIAGAPR